METNYLGEIIPLFCGELIETLIAVLVIELISLYQCRYTILNLVSRLLIGWPIHL